MLLLWIIHSQTSEQMIYGVRYKRTLNTFMKFPSAFIPACIPNATCVALASVKLRLLSAHFVMLLYTIELVRTLSISGNAVPAETVTYFVPPSEQSPAVTTNLYLPAGSVKL